MENDPDYDPEQPYSLPESLRATLTILQQSLKLTSSQSKLIYNDFWVNFSDDILPEFSETLIDN